MRVPRRVAIIATVVLAGCGLTACSPASAPLASHLDLAGGSGTVTVLDPGDLSNLSVQVSSHLFASSALAFVATPGGLDALVDDAQAATAPLLVAGPGVAGELERLGVETVVSAEPDAVGDVGGRPVVGVEPDGVDPTLAPGDGPTESAGAVVLLTDGEVDAAAKTVVDTNVGLAAGSSVALPGATRA